MGQDADMIHKPKRELSKAFGMKDLGNAKHILGMEILPYGKARKLWLSQERYIEQMLERFNMKNSKTISTPLAGHLKLSKRLCPSTEEEKAEMSVISYSLADISHASGVESRFLENPGKAH